MTITNTITDALAGKIDARTAEGRATIELVYAQGRTTCVATGAALFPRDDVWIEVVMPSGSDAAPARDYVGVSAAEYDRGTLTPVLDEWRANDGWTVEVWDGRVLWAAEPDE